MNRSDKIQLLKNLQQGKISIEDLTPEKIVTWYCEKGIYMQQFIDNALTLTEIEFNQYISTRPKQKNLIFKLQEGNEPLK